MALTRPSSSASIGAEGLGEQQEFRRLGAAEALRREQRGAGLRNEAKIDERHLETRGRRSVDEIAMKAERRPDADRQAVDRRDQRLFELGDLADEPPRRKVARLVQRDGEKIADVVAGGEHAALAAHHERADVGIALGRVEGFDQRFVHRAGDRVLLLRPGEGRRQDRALAGDLDVFRQLSWVMRSPPGSLRKVRAARRPRRSRARGPARRPPAFSAKKRARPTRPSSVSVAARRQRLAPQGPALARHAPPSVSPNRRR